MNSRGNEKDMGGGAGSEWGGNDVNTVVTYEVLKLKEKYTFGVMKLLMVFFLKLKVMSDILSLKAITFIYFGLAPRFMQYKYK